MLWYEEFVEGLDRYSLILMISGHFDIESGWKGVELLFAHHRDIHGIFEGNYLLVIGALNSLCERGIQVP